MMEIFNEGGKCDPELVKKCIIYDMLRKVIYSREHHDIQPVFDNIGRILGKNF